MSTGTIKKTESDTKEYIWNFEPLFPTPFDPNDPRIDQALKSSKTRLDTFIANWKDRTDYLTDINLLKASLDDYESFLAQGGPTGDVYEYLELLHVTNQDNDIINAKFKFVEGIHNERTNELLFFKLALQSIEQTTFNTFLEDPILADYRHYLELLLEEKSHTLSEGEERVLALMEPTSFSNWVGMIQNRLSSSVSTIIEKDEEKEVTFNEIFKYLKSEDKLVRDQAGQAISTILESVKEITEKEINSVLEYRQKTDTLRGFTRPDAQTHLNDDVETEVVDALVKSVTENFDISHEFYRKRAQKLGMSSMQYHERFIPIGSVDKKFEWLETQQIVLKVLENIDSEFHGFIKTMIDNNQVDVYPRSGKRGGAFCTEGSTTFPVHIMLNHNDGVSDVETFAHESGHAIHHHYFNADQNRLNAQGSIFTAEVASTFVEDFVFDELFSYPGLSDDEIEALRFDYVDGHISSIFRQIALYNFETELHGEFRKQGYLPYKFINELFAKHMKSYLGPSVEMDEGAEFWWIYWGHIRLFFYVYSYASGTLISKAMKAKFLEDKSFIEQVKHYMKAGSSLKGSEIFANIGIDIKDPGFWQKGLDQIRDEVAKL